VSKTAETVEAGLLLAWYDRAARDLPWRVGPQDSQAGRRADPYHVWLSEIMLQQTTVAAVTGYFTRFVTRWPDIHALAAAEDGDVMAEWAGLGYYARARNLLKCARVVAASGGTFPQEEAALQVLPGIGPYTAAAMAAIAFDRPAVVVDGNVDRVMARYHAVDVPIRSAKSHIRGLAAEMTPGTRPGDYAQAVMDLGATICTPRTPDCAQCPIRDGCRARAGDLTDVIPVPAPKSAKPERNGHIHVAFRSDGAVLLEQRPDKGLLGGTMGFPGSDWAEGAVANTPPFAADWQICEATVTHVFTHFRLTLRVHVAIVDSAPLAAAQQFRPREDFRADDLPTVMRKVWRVAMDHLSLSAAA